MIHFFLTLTLITNLFALNHLVNEPSPYLQQHKNNPVNWYPWGEEAFTKAKKEHKLIFLSIGYSTCHWCHVMMRESFEDKKVADILNRYYVSIKVDKEELPHIDQYFQKIYTQFHKRGGGWPLTTILTPEKQPLFSATYIPRYPSYGKADIITLLTTIAKNRDKYAPLVKKDLKEVAPSSIEIFPKNSIPYIIHTFQSIYDTKYSGFGSRPKFPSASMIKLLLELYQITHNHSTLEMATTTLTTMAHSGLYDQIDGGFFRYCIDAKWEIPHFEKMLYTNAELIALYTQAYQLTKTPLYKRVVQESISMIDTKFLQNGVYMSASNAESLNEEGEEEEGAYFLYEYDETLDYLLQHHIPKTDAIKGLKYFNITQEGTFDGDLSHPRITEVHPPKNIQNIKRILQSIRKNKKFPFIDYKINTAWNALYIDAKLQASQIDRRYAEEALYSLKQLLKTNYQNGILYHVSVQNAPLKHKALLEDYAFLIQALLDAYEITLKKSYLTLAQNLFTKSQKLFYQNGKWYLDRTKTIQACMQDKAYKNPLATLLQAGLFFQATQTHQLKPLLFNTFYSYTQKILQTPPYYATALEFHLQQHYGVFFIKSQKKNLINLSLEPFSYPFLYKFVTDTQQYTLCSDTQCYISTLNIKELYTTLKKVLKNTK